MRVQKAKEIKEVDIKAEKDMIELTILEAAENIEKYHKETKAWNDRKVVRKDIKTGDLVSKRKKNWENPGKLQEPWEGPYIVLTVYIRIKLQVDLQEDKSSVVVKGPFFPQV
jgi:hypothetical protein